jgi:hypothetical protein
VLIEPDKTGALRFERLESTWDKGYLEAIRSHYTDSRGPPPGKKMAWRIFDTDGTMRGYIGLGEPPFKLAPRRRLGLEDCRPLPFTVCCTIFRLEQPGPTKASDLLLAWHDVAAEDWKTRYGFAPVHWETMCMDRGHGGAVGACFRRAGYRSLGYTTGRTARRPPGHTHTDRVWSDGKPKLVLYRGPQPRSGPKQTYTRWGPVPLEEG